MTWPCVQLWQMPLADEYAEMTKSKIAGEERERECEGEARGGEGRRGEARGGEGEYAEMIKSKMAGECKRVVSGGECERLPRRSTA